MELKHEIINIAPQIWCISEFKLVNAFLVEGSEKAALIDTGCGYGDLGEAVKKLTSKPLIILLTHGHMDHNGGIYHFPDHEIYMNERDAELIRKMPADNRFRRFYAETRIPVRFPGEGNVEAVKALIPEPEPKSDYKYVKVENGDVFDLGDRRLTAIHAPGHTEGGICYLDSASRILFSGDTVNKSIILMRQPDNHTGLIKRYHDTLEKIWARADEYDRLAIGHDGVLIDKKIVKDYLELTEGLINGSITGAYEESGFRKGDVARLGMAELWYQCDA